MVASAQTMHTCPRREVGRGKPRALFLQDPRPLDAVWVVGVWEEGP